MGSRQNTSVVGEMMKDTTLRLIEELEDEIMRCIFEGHIKAIDGYDVMCVIYELYAVYWNFSQNKFAFRSKCCIL